MQKTFKELREVDQVVAVLYQKDDSLRHTKFGYAYKKFYEKNYYPTLKEMNSEIEDIKIDLALEDPNTHEILKSSGEFRYSKENLKKLNKSVEAIIEKYENKVIEFEPYVSPYKPEMTEAQEEVLKGVII